MYNIGRVHPAAIQYSPYIGEIIILNCAKSGLWYEEEFLRNFNNALQKKVKKETVTTALSNLVGKLIHDFGSVHGTWKETEREGATNSEKKRENNLLSVFCM